MVEALTDVGVLAHTRILRIFIDAVYGRSIPATRFSGLSAEEQRAHVQGRPRTVWLCHGLTSDRCEAIQRTWGLSSWDLADRIVAPTTGRVQHLRLTERICELALEADAFARHPEKMRYLSADLAGGIPSVKVRKGVFPLREWQATARELLEKFGPEDEVVRREAAAKIAASKSPHHQLFGVPEVLPVDAGREFARGVES
jgi:hypothetical protein